MMKFVFYSFIILSFFACRTQKEEIHPEFSKIQLTFEKGKYLLSNLYDSTATDDSYYNAAYIGEIKSVINLPSHTTNNFIDEYLKELFEDDDKVVVREGYNYPTEFDSSMVEIFVDTTRKMDTQFSNIKCYPVFIKNISKETFIIGYGHFGLEMDLTMEAKDINGEWRAIEYEFPFCGGVTDPIGHYLRPENIVLTGAKIYKGNFKTKLRLTKYSKSGDIHSNTFLGKIDEKQFCPKPPK